MKKAKSILLIIVLATLASCQKQLSSENNSVAAATYLNVSYGADPLQNMDIYLPADRTVTTTKVMVMMHGGAWTTGDKNELTPFVDSFKRRMPDYAIFNINYRLSAAPSNIFPTQENDVKAAIDFIAGKAAQYGISDKYAFIGASAGGHLALLQGYKNALPVKPRVLVSLAGPTDLVDMSTNPAGGNPLLSTLLASAVGKTLVQDPQLYANSSPVNFIVAGAPPTLLLYGAVDPLVSQRQPILAKDKLQAAGSVYQYVLYLSAAHVDTWSQLVLFDAFNKIQAFLTTNM